MPLYTYKCPRCNMVLEEIETIEESKEKEHLCHRCNINMKKQIDNFSFVKSFIPPMGKFSYAFGKHLNTDTERKNLIKEKGLTDLHDWRE